jgi:hypothetical protein
MKKQKKEEKEMTKRNICENCHNDPPADSRHLRSHKVKPLDEDEDEEEEEEEEEDEEDGKGKKGDEAVDNMTAGVEKLTV